MLSAKPKFVDEAASQLTFAGPLQRPNLSPGHMSHGQMHQQITSTVGGHKRSIQATTPENEQRPSQRTCRELFSPDSAQAAPALFAQQLVDMHLPRQPPTPTLGLASSELARRQATPTQVAHPPSATTPVPSVPVADPWSLLLANSSLVLRERLSSSNLTPAATATGRQLLELEVQLQALLGVRKDEEGSGNVCWVDHGFLHYAQGVMYFHRMYGDAECAQVIQPCSSITWLLLMMNNTFAPSALAGTLLSRHVNSMMHSISTSTLHLQVYRTATHYVNISYINIIITSMQMHPRDMLYTSILVVQM